MSSFNLNYSIKCFPGRFKRFLENKLIGLNYEKKNDTNFDIGSFEKANLIGISFPKCSCRKDRIHNFLKDLDSYPKSIIISNANFNEKKNHVEKLINKQCMVLKKGFSCGGKDVFIVKSVDDIKKIMKKNDNYILQKIIEPYLFINHKFDFRLYILYIKENNNYTAYFIKNGFARVAINSYKKNDQDSFLTNVLSLTKNRNIKKKNLIYYDTLFDYIKKNENKNIEGKIINCLKNIALKQIPFITKHNEQYFQNKKKLPYQFWLVGADIILDKNLDPFVLELNGEPGLISEQNEHNLIMLNNLWNHLFLKWIEDKPNSCNSSEYFIKLAEKN